MSEPPPSPSDLALILLLTGVYTLLRHLPAYIKVYSPRRPYAARVVALRHLAPLRGGYPHCRRVRQGHLHPHLHVPPLLLLQQPRGPPDVRH
jgi:hypothetical protein